MALVTFINIAFHFFLVIRFLNSISSFVCVTGSMRFFIDLIKTVISISFPSSTTINILIIILLISIMLLNFCVILNLFIYYCCVIFLLLFTLLYLNFIICSNSTKCFLYYFVFHTSTVLVPCFFFIFDFFIKFLFLFFLFFLL